MTALTLAAAVQISLLSTTAGYADAHTAMLETGKPLVVLVGADWCPGCRTMKTSVLPELRRRGRLDGVAFATVNTDEENGLARKLMRGGSIPQLVMYRKTAAGWRRSQLTGAQSVENVEAFIAEGVADAVHEPAVAADTASEQEGEKLTQTGRVQD